MSRALAIAAAAWSASARTRAISDALNASGRVRERPERAEDLVAGDERRDDHRADADVARRPGRGPSAWSNAGSAR